MMLGAKIFMYLYYCKSFSLFYDCAVSKACSHDMLGIISAQTKNVSFIYLCTFLSYNF